MKRGENNLARWHARCMTTVTAKAAPNIALVKYWGTVVNLDVLITRTTVGFQSSLAVDVLIINGYYIT